VTQISHKIYNTIYVNNFLKS